MGGVLVSISWNKSTEEGLGRKKRHEPNETVTRLCDCAFAKNLIIFFFKKKTHLYVVVFARSSDHGKFGLTLRFQMQEKKEINYITEINKFYKKQCLLSPGSRQLAISKINVCINFLTYFHRWQLF